MQIYDKDDLLALRSFYTFSRHCMIKRKCKNVCNKSCWLRKILRDAPDKITPDSTLNEYFSAISNGLEQYDFDYAYSRFVDFMTIDDQTDFEKIAHQVVSCIFDQCISIGGEWIDLLMKMVTTDEEWANLIVEEVLLALMSNFDDLFLSEEEGAFGIVETSNFCRILTNFTVFSESENFQLRSLFHLAWSLYYEIASQISVERNKQNLKRLAGFLLQMSEVFFKFSSNRHLLTSCGQLLQNLVLDLDESVTSRKFRLAMLNHADSMRLKNNGEDVQATSDQSGEHQTVLSNEMSRRKSNETRDVVIYEDDIFS